MSHSKEVLIWTKDGVWLQTESEGQVRHSFVGPVGFEAAREWARSKGLDFQRYPVIKVAGQRGVSRGLVRS